MTNGLLDFLFTRLAMTKRTISGISRKTRGPVHTTIPLPDSLEHRFVASDYSEGSDWESRSSSASLSELGQPSKQTDSLNGRDTIGLDGDDDAFDSTISGNQPSAFVIVARPLSNNTDVRILSGDDGARQILSFQNGNFAIYGGNAWVEGPTADTDWHIFSCVFDGSSSKIRIDGTTINSGNAGSNDYANLRLGVDFNRFDFLEMDISELWVLDDPTGQDREDADAILNEIYNIY